MKNLKTVRRALLADDEERAAYDALADEFAIAHELIAARTRAGLSQVQVAERMGAHFGDRDRSFRDRDRRVRDRDRGSPLGWVARLAV